MAFVVEDGTGVANANSYATVEFADAYFEDRGNTDWTGDDAAKQKVLVRATDYVEGRFGLRFIGEQKTLTQSLSWPRYYAAPYEDDVIPLKLQKAVCEYAVRAISGKLAPDLEVTDSGHSVVITKEKVGPIETEYAKANEFAQAAVFRPYPEADMLLAGLLDSASGRTIR